MARSGAGRHRLQLVGPEEGAWLARLEEEGDNLRAALRWALDRREADTAVRFASVLWRFWATRGHLAEGRRWPEAILALTGPSDQHARDVAPIPPLRRAMLLHVTAILARLQGDYARTETLFEECLAIRRAHEDQPGIIAALHNLGITASEQGDHARAIRLFEAALPLAREIGEPYSIAFGLTAFGEAVRAAGDPVRAAALHEEGLGWFRRIGHTWGIAQALTRLGDAALGADDRARAAALHRESLALSGGLGDPRSVADALEGLAQAEVGADPALAPPSRRRAGPTESRRRRRAPRSVTRPTRLPTRRGRRCRSNRPSPSRDGAPHDGGGCRGVNLRGLSRPTSGACSLRSRPSPSSEPTRSCGRSSSSGFRPWRGRALHPGVRLVPMGGVSTPREWRASPPIR